MILQPFACFYYNRSCISGTLVYFVIVVASFHAKMGATTKRRSSSSSSRDIGSSSSSSDHQNNREMVIQVRDLGERSNSITPLYP